MQSGISASAELQDAFNKFTADSSQFALPVTIANESLQPLTPVPFAASGFRASLPALSDHLQAKTPIYLLVRQSKGASDSGLVAVTFVPYNSPVRSKTLFAATRSSLVRSLGLEKFSDTLFVTEAEEVLDPAQWDDRIAANERAKDGVDTTLLTTEERELQGVRRAEDAERHGTGGRDLMGDGGSGTQWAGSKGPTGSSGVMMKVTDEARTALGALKDSAAGSEGGHLLQLGIDVSTETLTLLSSATNVTAGSVPSKISATSPTYSFYHFPGTSSIIFVYCCPGTAKVKERMVYASSRNGVIELARGEGVVVKSKLEAGAPDDITEQRLREEAGVEDAPTETAGSTVRQGFARPRRPGKR